MRKLFILCLSALVVLGFAAAALAGPGSVVIKTDGGITATFGGVVLVEPTWESQNDFDKTNVVRTAPTLATNAAIMTGSTTRAQTATTYETHDPYGHGSFANNTLYSSVSLFFNFNKKDIWDVFIDLNFQGNTDNRTADFGTNSSGAGYQSQRGLSIRQLAATYKLAPIASRFYYGWANYMLDDVTGMVFFNNDPSFAIYGSSSGFSWDARFIKRIEGNGVNLGTGTAGAATTARDADSNVWTLKLDYNVTKDYKVGIFYALFDAKTSSGTGNIYSSSGTSANVTLNYIGLQARGTIYGAYRPAFEAVYEWGEKENFLDGNAQNTNATTGVLTWGPNTSYQSNPKVRAWMVYAGLDANLTKLLGAPWNLTPYVKYLWTQGDKNAGDSKVKAFKSIVGGTMVAIGNKANILMGNNNVIGTNAINANPNEMSSVSGTVNNAPWGGLTYVAVGATANPVKDLTTLLNIYYARYNVAPTYTYGTTTVSAFGTVIDSTGSGNGDPITSKTIGWGIDATAHYKLDTNVTVGGLYGVLFPGSNIKDRVNNQGISTTASTSYHGSKATAQRLLGQVTWSW